MNIKVGNTPMLKIKYKYKEEEKYIYSKLEFYNLTGSIKDRVALYIIQKAYENKDLVKGKEIVEATSGNTGISLSAIGAFFGNPVHIFMPNWVSAERLKLMKMYGTEVTLISKEEGGFRKALEKASEYAKNNNAFLSNQFENENNLLAHYETTAKEIVDKLGDNIDVFVSGIGTGGTLMGVMKHLKEINHNVKIYALEPDKMPLLSKNKIISNHKIEGIGDDFIPALVNKSEIDKIILVNDDDAINMAKKFAIKLGLGVGISSGANFIASIIAKEQNDGNIVTVFPDDNKKYLSTDLGKNLENKLNDVIENKNISNTDFISDKIELLDYEFV